jgi:WD40 repeat protein
MEARHLAAVDSVRLTDDQQLVTTGANGVRRVWRVSDAQIVERPDRIFSASLGVAEDGNRYVANAQSPDGRFATVLVSDNSLYVWDLSETNSPDPLDIESSNVTAIAVSNNGRVIATGDTVGRVRLYSIGVDSASERSVKLQANGQISALAFNTGANRIAAGTSAGELHIWSTDASSMRQIDLGSQVSSVVFERDGAGVAAATVGEVTLVQANSDTVTSRLPAPGFLRALALSRDGQIVAAGDRTGVIRIWDRRSSRQIAEITQSGGVLSLAFSADGSRIAAGSENQLATIWQWRREDLIRDACARLGVNYGQTETYRRACPQSTSR